MTIPDRLSFPLVGLAVVGSALYSFAVFRYAQLWRKRRSGLLLAFAVAFVLLAEAMIAVAVGRSWHASWWEWHVLMLVAFGLIAWAAHREWHEERFSPLYGDETAAAHAGALRSLRRPPGLHGLLGERRRRTRSAGC